MKCDYPPCSKQGYLWLFGLLYCWEHYNRLRSRASTAIAQILDDINGAVKDDAPAHRQEGTHHARGL